MGHYKSNLRDIEFTLFEVLGRGDVLVQANDWSATQCKPIAQQSAPIVTMRPACRSTTSRLGFTNFSVNSLSFRCLEQSRHCLHQDKWSNPHD